MYHWIVLWSTVKTVLSYPLYLLRDILVGIAREYSYVTTVLFSGRSLSLIMIWGLLKACLLFIFIAAALFLLIKVTIKGVLSSGRKRKSFLVEIILIVLTLFVYYAIFSIGLYVFLNVIIPIYLEL